MIQTWILHRNHLPTHAVRTGSDAAVCGDCPARGRWCYVQVGQAPNRIWQSYRHGDYPPLDLNSFRRRAVRIGAYGDPAAVPSQIWARIASVASFCTGYTHAWRSCDPSLKRYLMASVDSLEEYHEAKALGWRCYRVTESLSTRLTGEAICPHERSQLQCIACRHCDGLASGRRGDVVTLVRGLRTNTSLSMPPGTATEENALDESKRDELQVLKALSAASSRRSQRAMPCSKDRITVQTRRKMRS
jgi:hypothetical protein